MEITAILTFIFILPGFISYLVVKHHTISFGEKADAFEKTLISLLFDVPIFLTTILISSQLGWDKGLPETQDIYSAFNIIDDLIKIAITALFFSIAYGYMFLLFIWFIGKLPNPVKLFLDLILKCELIRNCVNGIRDFWRKYINNSNSKFFSSVWHEEFVQPNDILPVSICNMEGDVISEGFLKKTSLSGKMEDLEIKVVGEKMFREAQRQDKFKEIDFTYLHPTSNLKIIVYKVS
ncbi:hypothetical protein [Marinococcus sp. PL1-022]|uniref:hypothetical protein n=1 Tax=Marinococcus sp. PL1-022 TaxID=3095363 RepID=UPI0029C28321|nr:hypothetical protein [Marinococcus sp. PL1-022]MDX6154468.1 hypothetical protein [Marinococcus sp. PL1-022]